jgi:hypothetical protein
MPPGNLLSTLIAILNEAISRHYEQLQPRGEWCVRSALQSNISRWKIA